MPGKRACCQSMHFREEVGGTSGELQTRYPSREDYETRIVRSTPKRKIPVSKGKRVGNFLQALILSPETRE
jgi:hypothetical protein